MKTFTLIRIVLVCTVVRVAGLAAGQVSYPENFDLSGNWTGGPAGSYTVKTYANDAEPANDQFYSDAAVRESTYVQGGYGWRLRNEGTPYFLYECDEVITGFTIDLAHWNPAVAMEVYIEYSEDGGASYVPLEILVETWWTDQGLGEKEYQQYTAEDLNIVPMPGKQACIRISTDGNERLLIDNFLLLYNNVSAGVEDPQDFNAMAASENEIHLTFVPNMVNDDVVIVFDDDGSFEEPVGQPPVPGEAFAGGTLFYVGTESPQVHTGLGAGQTVHYKAWSYTGESYSAGLEAMASTFTATEAPVAWINEFHYDNDGSDVSEFVEVVVRDAGLFDLALLKLYLYNGSTGEYYASQTADNLDPGSTIDDYSIFTWYYPGIQNGAPEGLALAYDDVLINGQFLSYEGTFVATNGPAATELSIDVGVEEPASNPVGYSLQLTGNGISYSHFSWSEPADDTPGEVNNDQNIGGFTTWTGMISGNWHDPLNWDNGVPDATSYALVPSMATGDVFYPVITASAETDDLLLEEDASVDIAIDGSLTVDGSVQGQGILMVHSDESGSGSLITSSTTQVVVEQFIVPDQWHYIASPVSSLFSDVFEGMYLMTWNELTETWEYIEELGLPLNTGMTGYGLWADAPSVITFSGNVNAGIQSIPVYNTPGSTNPENDPSGYNLVGNPYPSALDWDVDDGAGWTRAATNVGMALYFWNGTQYASYVKGGPNPGPNGGTNIIPPLQGFFVKCLADEGGSITVDDPARVHSNLNFYKDQKVITDFLKVSVKGNLLSDELFLYINPESTFDFDGQFDAFKLFGWEEVPQVYIRAADSSMLSINAIPGAEEDLTVRLGFRAASEGLYEMSIADSGVFSQSPLFLVDSYLQSIIDLHVVGSHKFHSAAGIFDDRFELHLFDEEIPVQHHASDFEAPYVFVRDGRVVIRSAAPMRGDVIISDLVGKKLAARSLRGQQEAEIPLFGQTGLFIVHIRIDSGLHTQKVLFDGQASKGN